MLSTVETSVDLVERRSELTSKRLTGSDAGS